MTDKTEFGAPAPIHDADADHGADGEQTHLATIVVPASVPAQEVAAGSDGATEDLNAARIDALAIRVVDAFEKTVDAFEKTVGVLDITTNGIVDIDRRLKRLESIDADHGADDEHMYRITIAVPTTMPHHAMAVLDGLPGNREVSIDPPMPVLRIKYSVASKDFEHRHREMLAGLVRAGCAAKDFAVSID